MAQAAQLGIFASYLVEVHLDFRNSTNYYEVRKERRRKKPSTLDSNPRPLEFCSQGVYSTAARQPLPIIFLLDVITNLGLALIPARHRQAEHSRRQHLARRPVRVGPG